ncbi:PLD nuclease N-terminal domain-containing protein [Chloroflexi bacterium TSY]|nr:PLD nuclease N-terminal domain-containing protein [Chloroflexi bacterium TSY]
MMKKTSWQALSTRAKMRLVIMGVIQVSLLITALWDIRQRSAEKIRGNKRMWILISFINFVGPIAYFVFGRKPLATSLEEVAVSE